MPFAQESTGKRALSVETCNVKPVSWQKLNIKMVALPILHENCICQHEIYNWMKSNKLINFVTLCVWFRNLTDYSNILNNEMIMRSVYLTKKPSRVVSSFWWNFRPSQLQLIAIPSGRVAEALQYYRVCLCRMQSSSWYLCLWAAYYGTSQ